VRFVIPFRLDFKGKLQMAHPHVGEIVAQKCHCESRKFLIHFAKCFRVRADFRRLDALPRCCRALVSVYKIPVGEAVR
jgi:hypothetical protein